jgi:hypothetical protein
MHLFWISDCDHTKYPWGIKVEFRPKKWKRKSQFEILMEIWESESEVNGNGRVQEQSTVLYCIVCV